jgi:hypothetical protein
MSKIQPLARTLECPASQEIRRDDLVNFHSLRVAMQQLALPPKLVPTHRRRANGRVDNPLEVARHRVCATSSSTSTLPLAARRDYLWQHHAVMVLEGQPVRSWTDSPQRR